MGFFNSKPEAHRFRTQVFSQAMDENGSKVMISMLEDSNFDMIEMMIDEVYLRIPQLIVHPHANLFILKLINVCSMDQRFTIFKMVSWDSEVLAFICFNTYGTRVVQKLLVKLIQDYMQFQIRWGNSLLDGHVSSFLEVLAPSIVGLSKDITGHHIIQFCLKSFPAGVNKFLLCQVIFNTLTIAKDQFGCRVLQKCVDICEGKLRESLLSNITAHALELAKDPYGNHIVQHMLELNEGLGIIQKLGGSFVELSFHKYGSQVVMKGLLITQHANLITLDLLSSPSFSKFLVHPYGKSVLMAALTDSIYTQVNYFSYIEKRVTSNLQFMKDDIRCWEMCEFLEKKMIRRLGLRSMSLFML